MLRPFAETHISEETRIEVPCKDMDLDCLPDMDNNVPFGDYTLCYVYDSEKGMCPFVPLRNNQVI